MPSVRQGNHRYSSDRSSRIGGLRAGIHSMFSGRSTMTPRNPTPDSPKSPRFVLGLPNLSTTRLNVPYLTRSASNSNPTPSRSNSRHLQSAPTPNDSVPESPQNFVHPRPNTPSLLREYSQPVASTSYDDHHARRFVGIDPAEQHLAELARAGRRRRRHKRRREPTCAPKIKNRKIRAKIMLCIMCGMILTLVLAIYLALALSKKETEEFHVLLIIIILFTTIVFCHCLIRLCMMLIHPRREDDLEQHLPPMVGAGGFANPALPIQVALARDEEAAGIQNEATKIPPPAYGVWRESVRVDPNRIFWQRNEAALERQSSAARRPATANRPPSYLSEDGVDYVVEAVPRSTAPIAEISNSPHSSEGERGWQRAII